MIGATSGSASVIGRLPNPLGARLRDRARRPDLRSGRNGRGRTQRLVLRFDPSTGRAIAAGQLPTPVTNAAAATALGGTGYLVGGIGPGGSPLSSVIALQEKQGRRPLPRRAGAPPPRVRVVASSLRRPPADRRSRQQPTARRQRPQAHPLALSRAPGRRPRAASTSLTTRSSSTAARGIISNEEENEAHRRARLPIRARLICVVRASRGDRIRAPATSTSPTTPTCCGTARSRSPTRRTAASSSWVPANAGRRSAPRGRCVHDPPRSLGSPNGDTPLANGDILVSEVNGSYVDEFTRGGHLVWSTHLPIAYPSDPQQLGPNRYLVADYARPGGIYEFNRAGRILWSYHPSSGAGMLDHPSLAERLSGRPDRGQRRLPRSGRADRPKTKRIVWQYGRTELAGHRAGSAEDPGRVRPPGPLGHYPDPSLHGLTASGLPTS